MYVYDSLRSWRDFAGECFCFGSEAVNASGEAVRGLVKSWATRGLGIMVAPPLAHSRIPPATQAMYMRNMHTAFKSFPVMDASDSP